MIKDLNGLTVLMLVVTILAAIFLAWLYTKPGKKWLDELVATLANRSVAEIGISYAGTPDFAHEMAEKLEVLGAPISILETGSIIQTHTGEGAFAVMVRYE